MTISTFAELFRSSDRHHLMLLYDNELERSRAEIDCINRALADGQYCVYATVDANDRDFAAKLVPRINDYERHVKEGNFTLVNFKPFYETAANGQLTLFKQLKAEVEQTLRDRISSGKRAKALLVADAACNMSRHKQFDECVTVEGWWQDTYGEWMQKNLDITIICAHPSSVLKQKSLLTEQSRISHVHSLTLDLNDFLEKASNKPRYAQKQQLRILVAEPEPDLRLLYRQYLKSLPIEAEMVETGAECIEKTTKLEAPIYDLIIIDTHIKDINGLEVAKRILEGNPSQNIAFTSTWDSDVIESSLRVHSLGTEKYQTLHKPFRFSQLLSILKPAEEKQSQT